MQMQRVYSYLAPYNTEELKQHDVACDKKMLALSKVIIGAVLGTVLYFSIYGLLARGNDPLGTFFASTSGGVIGLWFCSKWMKQLAYGGATRKIILLAYCARIAIGLFVYLSAQDPAYFDGPGNYIAQTSEFERTFDMAKFAANNLKNNGKWSSEDVYLVDMDKNANIHTLMGWFFAAGDSRHSLDLAPLNAFHHALAGILISGIAIALGYASGPSLMAGIFTSWIPWAFPATIMWRDSIGLGWVVASLAILVASRKYGILGVLFACVPAGFLAISDRTPYFLLPLLFLSFYLTDKRRLSLNITDINYKHFFWVIILFIAFLTMQQVISNEYFFLYGNLLSNIIDRIVEIPLLFIRAVMGPFPWIIQTEFDIYTCFDYAFHVFQFAIFIVVFKYVKYFFFEVDIMFIYGVALWCLGLVATGVHTAYLAVGIPFILPKVFSVKKNISSELAISAAVFVFLNSVYILSGLQGSGLLMNMTGY